MCIGSNAAARRMYCVVLFGHTISIQRPSPTFLVSLLDLVAGPDTKRLQSDPSRANGTASNKMKRVWGTHGYSILGQVLPKITNKY